MKPRFHISNFNDTINLHMNAEACGQLIDPILAIDPSERTEFQNKVIEKVEKQYSFMGLIQAVPKEDEKQAA